MSSLIRVFCICGTVLLVCGAVSHAAPGTYQQTKDGKTTVWNSTPKPGDTATWFGERDRDGYATGVGTLTWYTGSGELYARYYGNMIHGRLDGTVNVHTRGKKTAHAYFTDGTRTSRWMIGPALSRRVPAEQAEASKQARTEREKEDEKRTTAEAKRRKAEQPVESSPPPPRPPPPKPTVTPSEPKIASPTPSPAEPQTPSVAESTPSSPELTPSPAETSPSPAEPSVPPSPSATSTPATPTPTPAKPTPKPATPTPTAPKPTPAPQPSPSAVNTPKEKPQMDDSLRNLIGPPSSLRSAPSSNTSSETESNPSSATSSVAQLTKEDAILLADAEARNAGYDLHDYHRPKAAYDSSSESWSLVYDKKSGETVNPDSPSHLNIAVEDKTKKAAVASP